MSAEEYDRLTELVETRLGDVDFSIRSMGQYSTSADDKELDDHVGELNKLKSQKETLDRGQTTNTAKVASTATDSCLRAVDLKIEEYKRKIKSKKLTE